MKIFSVQKWFVMENKGSTAQKASAGLSRLFTLLLQIKKGNYIQYSAVFDTSIGRKISHSQLSSI